MGRHKKYSWQEMLDFWHFQGLSVPGVNYSNSGDFKNPYKKKEREQAVKDRFFYLIQKFDQAVLDREQEDDEI